MYKILLNIFRILSIKIDVYDDFEKSNTK